MPRSSTLLIMTHHPSNSETGLRAPRLEPVPLPPVEEDYGDEKLWQFILRNDCYTFLPLLIFDNNSPTLAPPLPKQSRRLSISGGGKTISSHPRMISFSSFPPPTASISSPVANSQWHSYVTGTIGWRPSRHFDRTIPFPFIPQYPRLPNFCITSRALVEPEVFLMHGFLSYFCHPPNILFIICLMYYFYFSLLVAATYISYIYNNTCTSSFSCSTFYTSRTSGCSLAHLL